ncbi:MAG: hypothetical protein ACTHW7_15115 [Actinomycetaceae bacterium]
MPLVWALIALVVIVAAYLILRVLRDEPAPPTAEELDPEAFHGEDEDEDEDEED